LFLDLYTKPANIDCGLRHTAKIVPEQNFNAFQQRTGLDPRQITETILGRIAEVAHDLAPYGSGQWHALVDHIDATLARLALRDIRRIRIELLRNVDLRQTGVFGGGHDAASIPVLNQKTNLQPTWVLDGIGSWTEKVA
jgi:hypothetical protein